MTRKKSYSLRAWLKFARLNSARVIAGLADFSSRLTTVSPVRYLSRMPSLSELTTSRLKRIIAIMELIESLQCQVNSVADNSSTAAREKRPGGKATPAKRSRKSGKSKRRKSRPPRSAALAAK
jgi:hypothetical protein